MSHEPSQSSTTRHRAMVLVGAPGTGKGTQGRVLGQLPGYRFVSMGEILRGLDPRSDVAQRVNEYLHRGQLVPAELVIDTLLHQVDAGFRSEPESIDDVLVLDGVPRNIEQAKRLESHVAVECVIHLACRDDSIMRDRIRGRAPREGRQDDANDEVIGHRFEVYRQETEPLLTWYPAALVASVDATKTPLEVLGEITAALVSRSSPEMSYAERTS